MLCNYIDNVPLKPSPQSYLNQSFVIALGFQTEILLPQIHQNESNGLPFPSSPGSNDLVYDCKC